MRKMSLLKTQVMWIDKEIIVINNIVYISILVDFLSVSSFVPYNFEITIKI